MCCRGHQAPLRVQLLKPAGLRFPARIHRVPLRAPAMNRRPQAWRSRGRACAATAVLLGFLTVAAVRAEAETDADVRALLARRCISVVSSGSVNLSFAFLQDMMANTNLLGLIQDAYARQLPPGATPEFVVNQTGSNTFAYVNRHGERCAIRETGRDVGGTNTLAVDYYVVGERSFGRFESYVHVSVSKQADDLAFAVDVKAWPHNAFLRLLVRNLPPIERYFRDKTREMTSLTCRIVSDLRAPPPCPPKM